MSSCCVRHHKPFSGEWGVPWGGHPPPPEQGQRWPFARCELEVSWVEPGLCSATDLLTHVPSVVAPDGRKSYRRHVREAFWGIPEWGSRSGPVVSLCRRYTELLLARTAQPSARPRAQLVAVERTPREGEAGPEASPELGLEGLFGADAEGRSARTVVLLGPAGGGKTTALRKLMQDWASGKAWQDRFEYAFYIPCGAVSLSREPVSLMDLLLVGCPPGALLAEDVLRGQNSLLVLVDGFDELDLGGLQSDVPSSDPRQRQAPAGVVLGLLRRRLLAKSHLLVTTRPRALQSLQRHLRSARLVELLGFRPAQRQEYFRCFFEDGEGASRALESVRKTEALFSLCALPAVCWILCSICREKPGRDALKEIPEAGTVTDVHVALLLSLWGHRAVPSGLEGLCALALDGVLRQAVAFDEDTLKGHGLGPSDLEALSASGRVLHPEAPPAAAYRFTLFSFQEFFAALSCFVCAEGVAAVPLPGLGEAWGHQKAPGSEGLLLTRFLFGLSSARRLRVLQESWGCKTHRAGVQQELLRWVEEGIARRSFRRGERLLELCHCLYEAEDPALARSVMGRVHTLDLRGQLATRWDVAALSFCLSASAGPHSLRLAGCELEPSGLHQLARGLLKSSEIQ